MKKTIVLSSIALTLAGLVQVGCYVEPRQRVVYREYREAPPPPPPQEYQDQEQYRPLPAPPPPEEVSVVEGPDVQVTEFHEQLAPYGRWIVVADYGDCFVPADVNAGWRPYTVGHWVYTDSGMCWVSDERWGWATYHYGRWAFVDGVGWVWVPGSHWGPAWVAWRNGGGYCGWAPLAPRRGGVEVVEVNEYDVQEIPPTNYVFCEERYVTEPRVYERCVPRERNVTIINRTTNITNITVVNNHVVNRSWNATRIQRATGRTIRPVQIHEVRTVDELKVSRPAPQPGRNRDDEQRRPEDQRRAEDQHRPEDQRRTEDQRRAEEQRKADEQRRAGSNQPGHERPPGQPPEAPQPGGDARAAYDAEVQQINQQYAQDKAQMNQRFAMERRQRPPGPGADDMMHRQAQEAKELEQRHQQQLNAARRKYRQ